MNCSDCEGMGCSECSVPRRRPGVMAGVPCIRHTRIPVATVRGMLESGMTHDEILADFPSLTALDLEWVEAQPT